MFPLFFAEKHFALEPRIHVKAERLDQEYVRRAIYQADIMSSK